jgi:hypothetical protein
MYWAAFNGDECSDLHFPKNDVESPGRGIISRTFCEMLDQALPDVIREGYAILI